MENLSLSTLLTFGLPVLFFAGVGLLDLMQKFGYLQSEAQKLQSKAIQETHSTLKERVSADIKKLLDASKENNLQGAAVHSTLSDIAKKLDDHVGKEVNLLKVSEQITDIHRAVRRSASGEFSVKVRGPQKEDQEGKLDLILKHVLSHDKIVADLSEAHPPARFDLGEKPAHWCTARDLVSIVGQVHNDVIEEVGKLSELLGDMRRVVREERGAELDNLVKIVELLGTLLGRVETIQDKYNEIYRVLTVDE